MTNFFEQQDQARQRTLLLIGLYMLAVIVLAAGFYFLVLFASGAYDPEVYNQLTQKQIHAKNAQGIRLWHYPTFLLSLAIFIVAVGGGSLYKIYKLSRGGGSGVAEELGGQKITRQTAQTLREEQLLNVVEEMAIASGIAVPDVYVLRSENAINAFAAGWAPGNAAVAVTAGTLKRLNRQELQGVIAHEFSHIFNGDMQLNIKLMGVLHGILLMAITGQFLLRGSMFGAVINHNQYHDDDHSGRRDRDGWIVAVGLGLVILGYTGVFFGRIIQSAISRRREFLADASAVQFTRNPDGIASALKKIGGWKNEINNPNSDEASHFFFGDPKSNWLSGLFRTHPHLEERVQKLDPNFDGTFPETEEISDEAAIQDDQLVSQLQSGKQPSSKQNTKLDSSPESKSTKTKSDSSITYHRDNPTERAGTLDADHIQQARKTISQLPEPVKKALDDTYGTIILNLSLVIARNDAPKQHLASLEEAYSEDVLDKIEGLYPQLEALDSSSYLPIAQLSIPNLRQMSKPQYQNFRARMTDLIKADNKVTLFEFCIVKVLTHHLDGTFGNQNKNRGIYKRLSDVKPQIQLLLSILAFMPDKDQKSAQMAFDEGCKAFDGNAFGEMLTLLPQEQFGFDKLDSALDKLERTTGNIKKQIVSAASRCIRADDKVDTEEMELLRTICEIIEVPIPPLLRATQ